MVIENEQLELFHKPQFPDWYTPPSGVKFVGSTKRSDFRGDWNRDIYLDKTNKCFIVVYSGGTVTDYNDFYNLLNTTKDREKYKQWEDYFHIQRLGGRR